jgi:acyl dehydratase
MICFTPEDLALFPAARHDYSGLHVSDACARTTAFGEPVVFGTLAAVGASPARPGQALRSVALTFRNPVFCGVKYDLGLTAKTVDRLFFYVGDAGRVILTGSLDYRAAAESAR